MVIVRVLVCRSVGRTSSPTNERADTLRALEAEPTAKTRAP